MSFRKKHWVLGASILAASALIAGCGGSDDDDDPVMPDPPMMEPEPPATDPIPPSSEGSIASISPTTGLLAYIRANMDADGNVAQTIEAGMSWTPENTGVTFMCPAGDADCEIMLSLGDDDSVMGSWERAEDMGDGVTAMFNDPFGNMNDAATATVAGIIMGGFGELTDDASTTTVDERLAATDGGTPEVITPRINRTADLGLKALNHEKGPKTIDDLKLTGLFDPNQTTATLDSDDDIGMDSSGAVSRGSWDHRILHADWGDTAAGIPDAGIETIAAVYSNIEAPMLHPFANAETLLAAGSATAGPRMWFILTPATDPNPGTVTIQADASDDWVVPAGEIVIDTEEATVAHLRLHIDNNEVVRGTYFGAPGTLTCVAATAGECIVRRATTQDADFTVMDENGATAGTGAGDWRFDPDPDAMVMLPDQDWLAYGFWLTAPNLSGGVHRLGVFFDGMETYGTSGGSEVGDLTGSATYVGDATGYYVNGSSDGMFTATATLTADFEMNAANDAAGSSLSGRIEDFVDTQGRFIATDTRANPNDPNAGGEGDWSVILDRTDLGDTGALTAAGTTSGTADGEEWDGAWNAQLYGPGHRLTPQVAPSGVAGNFEAITGNLGTAEAPSYRGVVGAFGAELTVHTPAETP